MKKQIKQYIKNNDITEFELGTDEWVEFITHLNPNTDELDFDKIESILEDLDIEVY